MPFLRYIPICTFIAGIIGVYASGSISGLLAGVVIGGVCDFYYKKIFSPAEQKNIALQNFSLAFLSLSAKLAKADGAVSTDEIAVVKQYTAYALKDYKLIGLIFNDAGKTWQGYETYVAQLRSFFFAHPAQKLTSLKLLYRVAAANGEKNRQQLNILQTCASQWGITQQQLDDIEASITFKQKSSQKKTSSDGEKQNKQFADVVDGKEHYKTLGVRETATQEEIKQAYKKLIRKYHPDFLRGQGKSEKEIQKGDDKLQSLNEAYTYLQKKK
jgi:DnaJ like chaperone protein